MLSCSDMQVYRGVRHGRRERPWLSLPACAENMLGALGQRRDRQVGGREECKVKDPSIRFWDKGVTDRETTFNAHLERTAVAIAALLRVDHVHLTHHFPPVFGGTGRQSATDPPVVSGVSNCLSCQASQIAKLSGVRS